MIKKKLLLVGLVCALAAGLAWGCAGGDGGDWAAGGLMGWKAGRGADIGAGDGKYTLAAAERVVGGGRVYATEIDAKKLEE